MHREFWMYATGVVLLLEGMLVGAHLGLVMVPKASSVLTIVGGTGGVLYFLTKKANDWKRFAVCTFVDGIIVGVFLGVITVVEAVILMVGELARVSPELASYAELVTPRALAWVGIGLVLLALWVLWNNPVGFGSRRFKEAFIRAWGDVNEG